MSFYDALLRYTKLLIKSELEGVEDGILKDAYHKVLDFTKPKRFTGKDNVLLNMDKSYTKTIFAFAENNIENSSNFTMFQFRTAIEMLKERNEKYKQETEKIKA